MERGQSESTLQSRLSLVPKVDTPACTCLHDCSCIEKQRRVAWTAKPNGAQTHLGFPKYIAHRPKLNRTITMASKGTTTANRPTMPPAMYSTIDSSSRPSRAELNSMSEYLNTAAAAAADAGDNGNNHNDVASHDNDRHVYPTNGRTIEQIKNDTAHSLTHQQQQQRNKRQRTTLCNGGEVAHVRPREEPTVAPFAGLAPRRLGASVVVSVQRLVTRLAARVLVTSRPTNQCTNERFIIV